MSVLRWAVLVPLFGCSVIAPPPSEPAPPIDAPEPEARRPLDHIVADLLEVELQLKPPDERVRQCNLLIDKINEDQSAMMSAKGSDPEALRQLARILIQVADAVAAVRADDDGVVRFRDEYAKLSRDLSAATLRTAEALERNNPKEAADAARSMTEFGPREGELVKTINEYCQTAYAKPDRGAEADCLAGQAHRCLSAGAYYDRAEEADEARALALYQRGCEDGDAKSCATAADAQLAGIGTTRDEHKAFELYARGCKLGAAYACSKLGERLWTTSGRTPQREADARRLWTLACEAGEGAACRYLLEHAGHKQDETRETLRALCKKGAARACEVVGD
jgi:TPR repeat protein